MEGAHLCYRLLSGIDDRGKKNAPRSMSHGTLIEPLPREAHKQTNCGDRVLDMAPMGYMETLSSGSGLRL